MTNAYLTVDDAPSAAFPEKLDILQEYDIPALFFCEGRRLADYSEQVHLAVEDGYHLGNHTYSHRPASELSATAFRDELTRTESLLEDVYHRVSVTGPARTFRFPYGDRGGDRAEEFQQILDDWGFTPPEPTQITYEWYQEHHAATHDWFWTISVEDWTVESQTELRDQVESSAPRLYQDSADIILFHDAGNTSELFEYFIELLRERGVELADPLDLLHGAPSGMDTLS